MNYGQRGVELLRELKRSDWLPSYNEDSVRAAIQEINLHTEELHDIVRANNRVGNNNDTSSGGGGTPIPIEMRPVMLLHEVSIKRNKRCLLAYHAHRIDKLRALRWETAGNLATPMKFVLSEAEVDFFHEYDKLASRHAIGGLHEVSIKRNKRCLLAYHAHRIDKLRALRWETAGNLATPMKFVLSEAEVDFFHEYDKLASRHAIGGSMGGLDWNADQNPPEENFIQVRVVQGGLGKIETEMCGVVELEVGSMHYLPRSDVEHLVRQGALVQLGGEESF